MDVVNPKKESLKNYLKELEDIEKLLTKRKEESGILYYVPNPKQYKFHCSMAKRILYVGSNRSGKTSAAMAELTMHATGIYPDWYPQEKRMIFAPKILWVSPQFQHLANFVEPKLWKYMPLDKVIGKPKRHSYGFISQLDVRHSSGGPSHIYFMSQEQKMMAFEGSDHDLVVADEPLSRSIYSSLTRGLLDRGGRMIFTLTPLEQQWMKEELCDKADGKFIEMFNADIRDNLFDFKGNPILNEEYIKEFEKGLTEEEKEIRLHGKWYHLSGLVFKEFDDEVHKVQDYPVPRDCPVMSVIDPHDRNPHWVIWAFVDKTDDVTICGEMIKPGTPEELAKAMMEFERAKGWKMRRRIIDPNFGNKPKSVGSRVRVIDQFRAAGLNGIMLGIDDDEAGKTRIRSFLRFDNKKPIGISNRPKLYFFREGARETIRALKNLQYDDWAKHLKDAKELKESVRDKNKHAVDCIRYLLCSNPKYERPTATEDLDKPIY